MGRPSKFHPEFPAIAARMRQLGMSGEEITFALGISSTTYWAWRKGNKTFKKQSSAPKNFRKLRNKLRGEDRIRSGVNGVINA
jgi:hypothetical protein